MGGNAYGWQEQGGIRMDAPLGVLGWGWDYWTVRVWLVEVEPLYW